MNQAIIMLSTIKLLHDEFEAQIVNIFHSQLYISTYLPLFAFMVYFYLNFIVLHF